MKTYNILYANPTSQIGGGTQSQVSLVCGLDHTRFHPIVIVPDAEGPLIKKLREHEIETAVMSLRRLRRKNPFPFLGTVFNLARFMRKKKIDLVHSNIRFTNQYLVPAARLARVPVVSHVRNFMNCEWFREYMFWLSDRFIANSYATERSYLPYLRKHQKSVVIHNGVDLAWFVPGKNGDTTRKRFGITDDTFLIGLVARIVPDKGHRWFIQALKKLAAIHPDICALIAGDTKIDNTNWYLSELKRQVRSDNLESRVVFTGFVDDMAAFYETLGVLVLPSENEPFGRVIIEAMAMEKPVIATKAGGAVEIVVDGETGFLVAYQDTDALVEALLAIIRRPQRGSGLGRKGRKRVEKLFDNKFTVEEIQELYGEILAVRNTMSKEYSVKGTWRHRECYLDIKPKIKNKKSKMWHRIFDI